MKFTNEQCIEALRKNAGFVSVAAKALGVTFQAVYKRISENEDIKEAYDEIKESHLDMAEYALISKIKDDRDLGSICFYLKTQGKKRGYSERQELTVFDGEAQIDRDEKARLMREEMIKKFSVDES
jgi:hypothetical protein